MRTHAIVPPLALATYVYLDGFEFKGACSTGSGYGGNI
jgi:hypothetical protein